MPHLEAQTLTPNVLNTLKQAAEAGNAKAQLQLGKMYASGDMVALNYPQAVSWIGLAAEQDLLEAKPMMAWFYANGFGVKQNDEKAAVWTKLGAEGGIAKCQHALAHLYRFGGGGIQKNPKAMLTWYHKAAEQHFIPAMHALGKLMATGDIVEEDKIGAYQWLTYAVLGGSEKAKESLSGLAARMSKKERTTAQEIMTQSELSQS